MYAGHTDIRDRTQQFRSCVASANKHNPLGNKYQPIQAQAQPIIKKSEFQLRASKIAKDISHTSEMLSKLALLAKKTSVFDNASGEIQQLTVLIKQDIVKIEKSLKNLQDYMKTGTETRNEELKSNSKNVVQLLNTKMKNVSGNFKQVLETRQKIELENKSRKERFVSSIQQAQQQNNIPQHRPGQTISDNPFMFDESTAEGSALLALPQDQQLQLLEEQSSQYLQERNLAVETIESTINEVGNLFQQLATMVNEQSEVVQRIDQNVEDIDLNIQGAQRELLKYFNGISNNRWLFLKVFGVLLMFFLLWIMVN